MPALRDIAIAATGWFSLVAFAAVWMAGGGKTVVDYATTSLQPLPADRMLRYDDKIHAIWSGWWTPDNGRRLTNDTNPKVVFLAVAAHDCSVALAAGPVGAPQTVLAALNGGEPGGRVVIGDDRTVVIAHAGDLVDGANVLALRLPDARKTAVRDERVESIGVRSIVLTCSD